MAESNIDKLQIIAEGLGNLNEQVVYVGGAVAQLYVTDPAATDIRPTKDVDCVIELGGYGKLAELEETLRHKKFENDQSPGAPICRWIYKGVMVDVMPSDKEVIGFSNAWYQPGIDHKEERILPNNSVIWVLPVTYYVATKFEALAGRGGEDYRWSHDFEDIVYILNSCPDFVELYREESNAELRSYLKCKCMELLKRNNILEEIECVLPIGEEERVEYILEVLNKITE